MEKEPQYKGYYLHAKEWGKPATQSIDYLTRPKETQAATPKITTATGNKATVTDTNGNVGGATIETKKQ